MFKTSTASNYKDPFLFQIFQQEHPANFLAKIKTKNYSKSISTVTFHKKRNCFSVNGTCNPNSACLRTVYRVNTTRAFIVSNMCGFRSIITFPVKPEIYKRQAQPAGRKLHLCQLLTRWPLKLTLAYSAEQRQMKLAIFLKKAGKASKWMTIPIFVLGNLPKLIWCTCFFTLL